MCDLIGDTQFCFLTAKKGGLGIGAIIGIVAGVVVFLIIILLIYIFVIRNRKRKGQGKDLCAVVVAVGQLVSQEKLVVGCNVLLCGKSTGYLPHLMVLTVL